MASVIWADRPSGFDGGCTPESTGRSPRGGRRWTASLLIALLLGAVGFAQGARTAIGFDGVRALASEPLAVAPATRTHARDAFGGSFWAPRGSTARPPEAHLSGRRWTPAPESRPDRMAVAPPAPAASGKPAGQHATPLEHR